MSPYVRLLGLCVLIVSPVALMPAATAEAPRATYNFNSDWKLLVGDRAGAEAAGFDDAAWKAVTLPHAWNEDEAFKNDIRNLSTGIAWYRKHFVLPPDTAGRKVFLEFEGVRQAAEVFLNGRRLGLHENGVMAFGFDVSDAVKPAPEENVLAVRTNNDWDLRETLSGVRFQWADRNFNANYGGITKNVRLHIANPLYQTLPLSSHLGTTGVYVYASDFDIPGGAATITAESEVRFEPRESRTFTYDVKIEDMEGRVVKSFSGGTFTVPPRERVIARASARVEGLHFWSWGYGYLYTVTTSLRVDGQVVDEVRTRTGFRKTEYANGMLKLNDRPIQIKGYAQRTTNEWPAIGVSVPPWVSDFSNRLMVESGGNTVRWMHITPWKQDIESCDRVGLMQLLPAGDSEQDAQGRSWQMRLDLMRDAIIYSRNNPSVVFYEAGNKGVDEVHMAEMLALRLRYDPHGGRVMGSREMLGSQVAEWGGDMMYINKSARQPYFATEYSRDEALRKYWDEFSPPFHKDGDGPLYNGQNARVYNRNQDSHAVENVVRWYDYWRERPGTGTRVNAGGLNIIFADSNTHHRGAENYRRSGEVDAMRIPKDGYWAHQVMWDAWVDVDQPAAHIVGHWNYAPDVKKNVFVVSSAERVELFLNGQSLGLGKQSSRFLFTFENVAWQPGTLRAVGQDAAGKQVCVAELQTAGAPVAVRLKPMVGPVGLKADAADLAIVEVEVVDAQGRRCPTALNLIDFELAGPAEWRGGIAQGPDNFILARSLPVECGVNRVFVRSTTTPGQIAVTAKSAGLVPATAIIESHAVATKNGLAATFPADGLPSYLDRGPTPAGPSFKVSRLAVPVAQANAADNQTKAALAYDDNETTSWTGKSPITFELARPARLSEITAKFAGWRGRVLPIRITVDGQEVFQGPTPRGMGYFTIAFAPMMGRTVKIEAVGAAETKDAFAGVTELANQKNASTGDEQLAAAALSVVEIEFYEPAAARLN
jgi:beta-galactosidase